MGFSHLMAGFITTLSKWRRSLTETETGQGLVEYALILVLVALVAFVVVVWLGPWIGNVFSNVINNL